MHRRGVDFPFVSKIRLWVNNIGILSFTQGPTNFFNGNFRGCLMADFTSGLQWAGTAVAMYSISMNSRWPATSWTAVKMYQCNIVNMHQPGLYKVDSTPLKPAENNKPRTKEAPSVSEPSLNQSVHLIVINHKVIMQWSLLVVISNDMCIT